MSISIDVHIDVHVFGIPRGWLICQPGVKTLGKWSWDPPLTAKITTASTVQYFITKMVSAHCGVNTDWSSEEFMLSVNNYFETHDCKSKVTLEALVIKFGSNGPVKLSVEAIVKAINVYFQFAKPIFTNPNAVNMIGPFLAHRSVLHTFISIKDIFWEKTRLDPDKYEFGYATTYQGIPTTYVMEDNKHLTFLTNGANYTFVCTLLQ